MQRLNILIISATFLLIGNLSLAQPEPKKYVRDFNNDGNIDTAVIENVGGSSVSIDNVIFTDGKRFDMYQFAVSYNFGSFFAICNIPSVLGTPGSESLGQILFKQNFASKPDPSLQWLMDACGNKQRMKNQTLIDFTTKYNPTWSDGNPVIPPNYFLKIEKSKYPGLLKNVEGITETGGDVFKSQYCWLTYYAHNHKKGADSFKITQVDAKTQLLTTAHGVVLKKGQQYSWVFINDEKLFVANEKLRWPSIVEALLINDLIYIRQSVQSSTTKLFVVNPQTGRVARLNTNNLMLDSVEKMEADEQKTTLVLSDGKGYSFALPLDKVKVAIGKL